MIVLWILGGIFIGLLLLGLTRVGILLEYEDALTVTFRWAVFRFRIFPPKRTAPPRKKTVKKPVEGQTEKKASLPGWTARDALDAVRTLWPHLKKALHRTRRSVRIDPLDVSAILGGKAEPADAAQQFGEIHGLVWAVMPVLEQLLQIPDPHIHLDLDFSAEETMYQGRVGISIQIWALLQIGWTLAVPMLRWYLAFLKKRRSPAQTADREHMTEPCA